MYINIDFYVVYDGELYRVSGATGPAVAHAIRHDDIYVTNLEVPKDGSYYVSSLKEMLPSYIYRQVMKIENRDERYNSLRARNDKMVGHDMGYPVSNNQLELDFETGYVRIWNAYDGYDENGEYFFKTYTIKEGYVEKKSEN